MRYGVGDFSGAEVMKGDVSVDVFEAFFAFFVCDVQFCDDHVNVVIFMKYCGLYVSGWI